MNDPFPMGCPVLINPKSEYHKRMGQLPPGVVGVVVRNVFDDKIRRYGRVGPDDFCYSVEWKTEWGGTGSNGYRMNDLMPASVPTRDEMLEEML